MHARGSCETLRGALFAVALGVSPLAAGCVSHEPLPSDIARAPAAWSGPPLPFSVGVLGLRDRTGELPPVATEIAHKSFVAILNASKIVSRVRDFGPGSRFEALRKRPGGAPDVDVDVLLAGEVEGFELYSSYAWWALYAALFAIPFAGTASVILAILLGGPVASDHGQLRLRLDAIEPRTGKVIGRYYGDFDEAQHHTIWRRVGVDESFVAHPEMMFQAACADAIEAMARDRFWLVRFKRQ